MQSDSGWICPADQTLRIKVARLRRVGNLLFNNLAHETHRNHPLSIQNQIESQVRVLELHSSDFSALVRYIKGFDEPVAKMRNLFSKWQGLLHGHRRQLDEVAHLSLVASNGKAEALADALQEELQSILEELVDVRRILKSDTPTHSEIDSDLVEGDSNG